MGSPTNWRERAACRGEDLSVFFPDTRGVEAMTNPVATAICGRCPVRRECLESPSERAEIIRKRKRRRAAA